MSEATVRNTRHPKRTKAVTAPEQPARGASVVKHLYEPDSNNYSEAMQSTKREGWSDAMFDKLAVLQSNEVWCLMKRPHQVGFKTKTNAKGFPNRLKAR